MRKNKKGDLMNNMVGIIVALIGILIFAYALVQLYNVNVNQEKENAKNVLNSIIAKIENLENGQNNNLAFQGFDGADGWSLVGYSLEDGADKRPEKCFFGSCICICEYVGVLNDENRATELKDVCQQGGICSSMSQDEVFVSERFLVERRYVTEGPRTADGSARYDANRDKFYYETRTLLGLSKNLFELNIDKTESILKIKFVPDTIYVEK